MYMPSDHVAYKYCEQKRAALMREAEVDHMLRSAGLIQPGFFARLGRHTAGWCGRWLVSLGHRLEHLDYLESTHPVLRAGRSASN